MKTLVLVCNIVSLVFTLLVIGGEGLSTETIYIVFTLLLIIIPAFTILALSRPRTLPLSEPTTVRLATISNLVVLGFVCWALVDQYPHPNEPGFVPYAVLMILTPVLSVVALLHNKPQQPAQV